MIKANEIRYGNWVQNQNGHPICVNYHFFSMIERLGKDHTEACSGIPITEEWAIKMGVVTKMGKNWFNWGGMDIPNVEVESMIAVKGRDGLTVELFEKGTQKSSIGKPCKYVHEVQNLYFVLSGEELEVKL